MSRLGNPLNSARVVVFVFAFADSGDDRAERIECRGMDCGTPASQVHARRDEQLPTHTPTGADAKGKQQGLKVETAERQTKRFGATNEGRRGVNE